MNRKRNREQLESGSIEAKRIHQMFLFRLMYAWAIYLPSHFFLSFLANCKNPTNCHLCRIL